MCAFQISVFLVHLYLFVSFRFVCMSSGTFYPSANLPVLLFFISFIYIYTLTIYLVLFSDDCNRRCFWRSIFFSELLTVKMIFRLLLPFHFSAFSCIFQHQWQRYWYTSMFCLRITFRILSVSIFGLVIFVYSRTDYQLDRFLSQVVSSFFFFFFFFFFSFRIHFNFFFPSFICTSLSLSSL